MSTSRAGRARRKLSIGTRLWPPASTVESSSSSASTSSSESGELYSNGAGFTDVSPQRPPQLVLGERRVNVPAAQRVGHRVADRRRRAHGSPLPDALRAQ